MDRGSGDGAGVRCMEVIDDDPSRSFRVPHLDHLGDVVVIDIRFSRSGSHRYPQEAEGAVRLRNRIIDLGHPRFPGPDVNRFGLSDPRARGIVQVDQNVRGRIGSDVSYRRFDRNGIPRRGEIVVEGHVAAVDDQFGMIDRGRRRGAIFRRQPDVIVTGQGIVSYRDAEPPTTRRGGDDILTEGAGIIGVDVGEEALALDLHAHLPAFDGIGGDLAVTGYFIRCRAGDGLLTSRTSGAGNGSLNDDLPVGADRGIADPQHPVCFVVVLVLFFDLARGIGPGRDHPVRSRESGGHFHERRFARLEAADRLRIPQRVGVIGESDAEILRWDGTDVADDGPNRHGFVGQGRIVLGDEGDIARPDGQVG